ncbi:hypothetical protein [Flavobacterium sp. CAN_S2]|uniref:hypothetical protein n=1 Tax=Flavobacterium sp. CAN_S2 TaxID=2787726 RepID=UPI0018CA0555
MTPKDRILKIMEKYSMTPAKASEIMGITYHTFSKNKNDKETRHSFNEKNYNALVTFLIKEGENLSIIKNVADTIDSCIILYTTKNYSDDDETKSLEDALSEIVVTMELHSAFDDYDVYHHIINKIEFDTLLFGINSWTITKHKAFINKSKSINVKWNRYLIKKRSTNIFDIINS